MHLDQHLNVTRSLFHNLRVHASVCVYVCAEI